MVTETLQMQHPERSELPNKNINNNIKFEARSIQKEYKYKQAIKKCG